MTKSASPAVRSERLGTPCSVAMSADLLRRAKAEARRRGLSLSALIREAVRRDVDGPRDGRAAA